MSFFGYFDKKLIKMRKNMCRLSLQVIKRIPHMTRGHVRYFMFIAGNCYFAMYSYLSVSVGWSHTSVGPKYCIGPGYM